MKPLFFTLLTITCLKGFSQDSITDEMRQAYNKNQHRLDLNQGGIGLSFYKPGLGKIVDIDQPWIGINMLSDVFEMKLGFGRTHIQGTIPVGSSYSEQVNTREYGTHFAIGFNSPLKFLTFGAQKSPNQVLRGHPIVSGEIGAFWFHNQEKYYGEAQTSLYYLGVNPGYRIRVPFGSIDINVNARLGMPLGKNSDYYKGIGIYPSLTFRFDALKWKYNPDMVSVQGTYTSVSNIQSRKEYAGTRYNSDGSSITYYNVYTTADVHVQDVTIGIQDIGGHIGIGPKISFMNPRRTPFAPESFLVGVAAEGRRSYFDFGATLEGGKVGHGSKLVVKDEEDSKYRKKLNKNETFGQGTLNTINLYTNIGFDISPFFLGIIGLSVDKGESTSFLSVTTGFITGIHTSFGQRYVDPTVQSTFDQIVADDQGMSKEKFLDPSEIGTGFLGGFYFSVQIGAMNFKITNYRYYGAPFASNTLMSIAYRFPVVFW